MVCQEDWEIQHPQERIRPIPDQVKLPWTRPESTDVFIGPNYTNTVDTNQLVELPIVILPNNPGTTTIIETYVPIPLNTCVIQMAVPIGTTTQSLTITSTDFPKGTGFKVLVIGTWSPQTVILDTVSYTVVLGYNYLGASNVSVQVIV